MNWQSGHNICFSLSISLSLSLYIYISIISYVWCLKNTFTCMHSIHATVHAYIQAPGTICKSNRQHYISALFCLSVVGSWVDPSANQCVGCSTPNCFHHELAMLLAAAPGHDHVHTCLSGSAQRRKPNWWQGKQYRDWNVAWNDSAISAVKTLMVSRGTGCWILYIHITSYNII